MKKQSRPQVPLHQYFEAKGQKKPHTNLGIAKSYVHVHKQFVDQLKRVSPQYLAVHFEQSEHDTYTQPNFQQIKAYLQTDNNICFYGFGSKETYINNLVSRLYQNTNTKVFVVYGYLPTINERTLISQLVKQLNKFAKSPVQEPVGANRMVSLRKILQKRQDLNLVIVIHSLDGPSLFNASTQANLSQLGLLPNVRIIASVDNAHIDKQWSSQTIHKFGFIFLHVRTANTYINQLQWNVRSDRKHDRQQQALKYIWRSFTVNQKQILKILARRELAILSDQGGQSHFTLSELLDECIKQMLLPTESQLRENLSQMLDHKVVEEITVRSKKVLVMGYDRFILESIVNDKFDQSRP